MSKALSALLLTPVLLFQAGHSGQPAQKSPQAPVASKAACSDVTALPANRPTPEACAEVALYGHPVLFPARNGIAYGVSAMPDKPLTVHIWMDNRTDDPQPYFDICSVTFASHVDIYDSSGHRVPAKHQPAPKKPGSGAEDIEDSFMCSCCIVLSVPPHSLRVVDHGDLSLIWTLPSGNYTIIERPPTTQDASPPPAVSPTLPPSGPRLPISLP